MKKNKYTIAALLVILLISILTACTGNKAGEGSDQKVSVESAAAADEDEQNTDASAQETTTEVNEETSAIESEVTETMEVESEEDIELDEGKGTAGM